MKLLLLPASSKIPLKHFNDSIRNPVSIEKIKEFANDEMMISNLDQSNSLWGFKRTKVLERIWNSINEHDIVLFLSKGEFYYQASIGKKFVSKELAKEIWDTDKDNKTWELIFTLKNGSENPEYTWDYIKQEKGYSKNDHLQGPRYIDYINPLEIELNKIEIKNRSLTLKADKPQISSRTKIKRKFIGRKPPNYFRKAIKDKKIGEIGEELVLNYEKEKLSKISRMDLVNKVEHISKTEGDGTGYDIKSYDEKGNIMHIEVKTTEGGLNSDFFMSPNEIAFSEENKNTYYLYRLYNLKLHPKVTAVFYKVKGNINNHYEAEPIEYKMYPKEKSFD